MINNEIRSMIAEINENAILFDNPSFDNSIIGISHDNRVIYSYEKMIDELTEDDGIEQNEAIDFIEYNTIRTLEYIAQENSPIIMYSDRFM